MAKKREQFIKYIEEEDILKLPTYVCARTTRLTYENAVFMWNTIHEERIKVFVYDRSARKRYETALKYDTTHRLSPFSLITCDYLVFVESWELMKLRLMGDYSFEVVRSDGSDSSDDSCS